MSAASVASGASATAVPSERVDAARFLLVVLHLLGVYLAVPLRGPGGFEFPVATMIFTVPVLLAINLDRIRSRHLYPMIALVGIAMLTVVFAPQAGEFFGSRLKGLVQWTWSIASAYALVLELSRWSRADMARLLGGASAVILVGCVLENYGGLRDVSNVFRRLVFVSVQFEWLARDIEIVGMLRPRLFTSEPSDVAKFFTITTFGWIALSTSRYRHAMGPLLTIAGFFLIRSPIVLLVVPLQAVLLTLGRPLATGPMPLSKPLKASVLLVVVGAVTVVAAALLLARVQALISGAEPSAIIRIAAPVIVAGQTVLMSPVWGAGISGTESIADIIVNAYTLFGLAKFADPMLTGEHMTVSNLITNAFWLHWINFGLFGGLLAVFALAWWMKALGIRRRLLAFVVIFAFAQTMGAEHGPYFWAYVALILAICRHLDEFGPVRLRFVPAVAHDAPGT
jgi:hypothetical protein